MKKDEKSSDEGVRDFGVFLTHIDDGTLHEDAGRDLQRLAAKLSDHVAQHGGKAKGTLTLTVNLTALANGTVDVVADVKVKEPKAVRARSVFWLTKGNNLSHENPRQQKLPLREVPPARTARDLDDSERTAPRTL